MPTSEATLQQSLANQEEASWFGWDEILSATAVLTGSGLVLAADLFGAHRRWAKVGGVLLTVAGMIPSFVLLREVRRARKAAAGG